MIKKYSKADGTLTNNIRTEMVGEIPAGRCKETERNRVFGGNFQGDIP